MLQQARSKGEQPCSAPPSSQVGSDLTIHYRARVIVLHVREEIGTSRVPEGLEQVEHIEHMRITETEVLHPHARAKWCAG